MEERHDVLPPEVRQFAPWTWSRTGKIGFIVYACVVVGVVAMLSFFVLIVELHLNIPLPLDL